MRRWSWYLFGIFLNMALEISFPFCLWWCPSRYLIKPLSMFEDVWIGSSQRRFPTSKINIITCYYKSKGKIEVVHMFKLPVVPLEAVPEVSKGRKYNPSEHVPIEPFAQNIPASTANAHSVLQSPTPYYSVLQIRSTTPYYKALLQYYKIQSTTKYYSSTVPYYSVLQSTTPYYKVLLQHYSVLRNTTQYYNVLQKSSPYYKVLHSTTPYYKVRQLLHSTTMYYKRLVCTTRPYTILLRTTKYYTVLLRTNE